MALDIPIDDNNEIDRHGGDASADPVPDRSTVPERLYLTHDEAAAEIRGKKKEEGVFDRWRHLPTLELHYYPRGIEPANPEAYVRFLP